MQRRRSTASLSARASRDEAGFALPTAIIVLFVVIMLTAAAVLVSVQASTSTTRDNNVKAELEAAEAGLQVATYRLSEIAPGESECISEGKKVKGITSGNWESKCSDSWEELGNGATFRYFDSLPLTAGKICGGREPVVKSLEPVRCITAEGKVNGVEPAVRLQIAVRGKAGEAMIPVPGVTGLEEFTASGGTISGGVAGSNGKLEISGGASLKQGYVLGPKGVFVQVGGATHSGPETKRTEAEGPLKAKVPSSHPTAESNEDSRIGNQDEFFTEGKAVNKFTGSPNYELNISSNGKLVLGGSKYYLCNFNGTNNGILQVKEGAKVEIFIDSPEDPAAKCAAGTGRFEATGSFKIENPSKDPTALIIEMYGKGPFVLEHGAEAVQATVIAPNAEVILKGGTTLSGGLVGAKVHLENGFSFEWNAKDNAFLETGATEYKRQETWEQCGKGSKGSEEC
jgi:type II secretory pathway pseudopilin PulG